MNIPRPSLLVLGLALLVDSGIAGEAGAQAGGASLQIPTSVRSEGMGRAYAPLERGALAAWANPGALGLITGLDAAAMNARLVPDLADDVLFDNQSVVFGVGIDFGDVPLIVNMGFNKTYLNYGESTLTGPGNDSIDVFGSYEETRGWTVALGVGDLVGVGVGVKNFESDLAGTIVGDEGRFEATAYDIGAYGRTPVFPFRKKGEPEPVWGATLVGGIAWLNNGGDIDPRSGNRPGDPLPRNRRESFALELDFLPVRNEFPTGNRWLGRLIRDAHVVSLVGTLGREDDLLQSAEDVPDNLRSGLTDDQRNGITNYSGLEVRLFDSLAFRYGYLDDEVGRVYGNTFGWGISVLGIAGVDWAEIPQFRTLSRVQKWSFWLKIPLDARL